MQSYNDFKQQCQQQAQEQAADPSVMALSQEWIGHKTLKHYSYHFEWMGRPIIQYPQDIVAMQELLWCIKPDLVVETGIAHGGSLIYYASLLELNALCGGPKNAHVLGIDIDIRPANREAIENHPMYAQCKRISMIEGSSIDPETIQKVHTFSNNFTRIMLLLDSNHTHEHVLAELNAYASLVSTGSYCVVFDTIIETMPANSYPDRPWSQGNNPLSAVQTFLLDHPEFEVDSAIDAKLLISVAPQGYLRKIK